MRRLFNNLVEVDAYLDDDESWWPRNVQIANESLSGTTVEYILAGAGYNDETDRESIATAWLWFPAICSEKPEDSTVSMMDTCRWEFVAIVLMALSGEGDEFEFM